MPKPPLLVLVVFHPLSDAARALAGEVYRSLNEEPDVPGLRIPTIFCPEDGDRPPELPDLDEAERHFVVVLSDSTVVVRDPWCRFVGNLFEACQATRSGFVPMQLSEHAWPLDDRLRELNFARAWASERLTAFVKRRVLIELCRYLHGDAIGDDATPAPTKLFVSHTKLDIEVEPRIFNAVRNYLTADQPVAAWIDSGDIPTGSSFAREIAKGVQDTSLLCVLTDNYASREWCRREILLAKEHQRPVVVIDGLQKLEVRSFPYLGNVPVVRWNGEANVPIDLLLKETLRMLHVPLLMESWREPTDALFLRPPELATLVGRPASSSVLYPDPPLSVEEDAMLEKTGVAVSTPMQRLAKERTLDGKRIAISVSESTDIRRYGFDAFHLDGMTLELCRYLLIRGATLSYGGHLGKPGYTTKLLELVRAHNERRDLEPFRRIVNYRGWPLPRLGDDEQAERIAGAQVIEVGRPADVDETLHADFVEAPDFFGAGISPEHRFAWARGMTAMREKQSMEACARIVVGGTFGPTEKVGEDGTRSETWYASRVPGVLEEIVLTVRAERPVFLIGALGGVAALVADLLEGKDRFEASWEFQKDAPHAPAMKALYEERGVDWWSYEDMVRFLREKGFAGLNPGLSEAESRELSRTRDVVRMVELVLQGLPRDS